MGVRTRRGTGLLLALLVAAVLATIPTLGSLGMPMPSTAEAPSTGGDHAEGGDSHAEGGDHGDHGNGHGAGHADPFVPILLALAMIVVVALLGRAIAARFDEPTVLGDLMVGVVLGNVGYALGQPLAVLIMHLDSVSLIFRNIWGAGQSVTDAAVELFGSTAVPSEVGSQILSIVTGEQGSVLVMVSFAIWIFSNLGVILLLFMVGLESSVEEMIGVGPRSLMVALIGIVAPFGLGYGSSLYLLPEQPQAVHLFLGATLCATSVGITARVFKDLDKIHTQEARIILGAAVIDDVLGLVILAVVVGIVATGTVLVSDVIRIMVLSLAFLSAVIFFGDKISKVLARIVRRLNRPHAKLLLPLSLAFVLSWAANQIELASIVGAFAAGLILREEHFGDRRHKIEDMIDPLEAIFAPIFFVLMGMQVNLRTFLEADTLWLALAFIVVAVIGKIVSGIPAGKDLDRLSVGLGMIPRGEVGLIFASIGKSLGVVTDSIFSAVVMMVIVTTVVTPVALKWSLSRYQPPEGTASQG